DVLKLLAAAELPDRVHRRAVAVFDRLAAVEGAIHGEPPAEGEFHEVGGLDALVDVVRTCAALETLGVAEVAAPPAALAPGTACCPTRRRPSSGCWPTRPHRHMASTSPWSSPRRPGPPSSPAWRRVSAPCRP